MELKLDEPPSEFCIIGGLVIILLFPCPVEIDFRAHDIFFYGFMERQKDSLRSIVAVATCVQHSPVLCYQFLYCSYPRYRPRSDRTWIFPFSKKRGREIKENNKQHKSILYICCNFCLFFALESPASLSNYNSSCSLYMTFKWMCTNPKIPPESFVTLGWASAI